MSHPTIAPADSLQREFRMLQDREVLRTTIAVETMIFVQSLAGRAHEGHGTFAGQRFVDTDEDDVARALRLDRVATREARQALVEEVVRFAERVLAGEAPRYLLAESGAPLFGIGTLRAFPVHPVEVLVGLYLGGMRDTQEIRLAAEARFGVTIGTGKHYCVDRSAATAAGLTGEDLARGEYGQQIEALRRQGIVVDERPRWDNDITYTYIRHHRGPGASDDAAIVIAGLRYGASVAAGVFLADVIDTLEKYVPPERYGDQDADLARRIAAEWRGLPVGPREAEELAYLAVGGDERRVPDSSLRHLLQIDRAVDQCAAEAHLLTAAGMECAPIGLGHRRAPSRSFYELLERRLARFERAGTFHDEEAASG